MFSRFELTESRSVTDRQTDGIAISISSVAFMFECRTLLQKYYASSWQRVRTLPTPLVYLRHWVSQMFYNTQKTQIFQLICTFKAVSKLLICSESAKLISWSITDSDSISHVSMSSRQALNASIDDSSVSSDLNISVSRQIGYTNILLTALLTIN